MHGHLVKAFIKWFEVNTHIQHIPLGTDIISMFGLDLHLVEFHHVNGFRLKVG
jgi:hypothetical protein